MTSRRFCLLSMIVFLVGFSCIELDSPNMSTQDYKSEVRFVNLSNIGSANVQLDNISFGSLSSGNASDYKEIDSGSRTLVVGFPETDGSQDTTIRMVFETEKKGTVFVLGDTTGTKYVKAVERYTFDAPEDMNLDWTHPDLAIVRVLNGLLDYETLTISVVGEDEAFSEEDLSFGDRSSYHTVIPGDYAVSVDTSGVILLSDTLTFATDNRFTVAVYNSLIKIFIED